MAVVPPDGGASPSEPDLPDDEAEALGDFA
jgi:hypothetical protein